MSAVLRTPAWHEQAVARDAAALSDQLRRQDEQGRQSAYDLAAARAACDAIKALSNIDFTAAVAAQIAAVLSARISACSWSHTVEAVDACDRLNDLHDLLEQA